MPPAVAPSAQARRRRRRSRCSTSRSRVADRDARAGDAGLADGGGQRLLDDAEGREVDAGQQRCRGRPPPAAPRESPRARCPPAHPAGRGWAGAPARAPPRRCAACPAGGASPPARRGRSAPPPRSATRAVAGSSRRGPARGAGLDHHARSPPGRRSRAARARSARARPPRRARAWSSRSRSSRRARSSSSAWRLARLRSARPASQGSVQMARRPGQPVGGELAGDREDRQQAGDRDAKRRQGRPGLQMATRGRDAQQEGEDHRAGALVGEQPALEAAASTAIASNGEERRERAPAGAIRAAG